MPKLPYEFGTACKIMRYADNCQIWETLYIYISIYIYIYNGYYTIPRHHLVQEMYKLRKGTQILVVFSHRNITLGNAHLSWHNYANTMTMYENVASSRFPCYVTGMFSGLSNPLFSPGCRVWKSSHQHCKSEKRAEFVAPHPSFRSA